MRGLGLRAAALLVERIGWSLAADVLFGGRFLDAATFEATFTAMYVDTSAFSECGLFQDLPGPLPRCIVGGRGSVFVFSQPFFQLLWSPRRRQGG